MTNVIKVMIVDDSAVVRQVLTALLSKDPQIQVLPSAADPILAQEKMAVEWPDVIILDVEMPRMDGITFLKKIMSERPTPVVICSTLTEKGAETTMQALAAGAVSYVTKPRLGLKDFLSESAAELIRNVKQAALSKPKRIVRGAAPSGAAGMGAASPASARNDKPLPPGALAQTTDKVIAIGTSTGGTQALEAILTALPRVSAGIIVVQHMPEKFTALFANRLNTLCAIEVREARHGDRVMPGRALIAPGGLHMRLTRSGAYYQVEVLDGPPVNRHKPSVDVLFKSVAQVAGRNALGIIMTGMGDDGARGLRDMHDAGAPTIGQDEASCVVYGMPREAVKLGAVDIEMPLDRIAAEMVRFYQRG
ncbi:chemotaxis response regulator protein-glutamate methylesterase [Actimicrobium sp. CCC2.4]|uniref:protein-glutamate methylesterase/protein-glutamine glutaminase n=1 Tax=Actimicrobium sp. CCC2.4 TaxID=3048606 RepID=UPI002AC9AB9B|nr:chemotaxis response regulator protein-glutamate methylesterase [Actimicrobium sp. CCC2.4]MEB0136613.1 chemotaxis response regulator protein-glutamate methylesterase [Actimicrobium sp. CCC2.4]WPX31701.1 chemotaxis response regulator protein-glutamate methylesterase [Actimicrobium sp. CCC2.4]